MRFLVSWAFFYSVQSNLNVKIFTGLTQIEKISDIQTQKIDNFRIETP